MGINLESSSSLSRLKRQHGINNGRPNAEQVPEYITRCQYNNEILKHKEEIMAQLLPIAPTKYAKMVQYGFDSLIMTMGPSAYSRFCSVMNEGKGIVEAYLAGCIYNHKN